MTGLCLLIRNGDQRLEYSTTESWGGSETPCGHTSGVKSWRNVRLFCAERSEVQAQNRNLFNYAPLKNLFLNVQTP